MATKKAPFQRSLSSENIRMPLPFKRPLKKQSANVRAYNGFVRDVFCVSRVPLFRSRSFYELCPLGVEPEPRDWPEPPPSCNHSSMPLAPTGTFGAKPVFQTEIDYSTFQPRRSNAHPGARPMSRRYGDYNPTHARRAEPIDKQRGDRRLERKIDEQRSWRVVVPSVYPTSWEKAYLYEPSRFKSFYSLLPNSSIDCYSFSNPRSHKAALMAATMRTSPDFWKYTFPHEYLPSWRLAHLDYYFTHGYNTKREG